MKYKEFKEKINKIANDYHLNLKVTEDAANIYIKMGEMICAYTKRVVLGFINTDFGSMYYFNEKPKVEMLEALCELSKTPFEERQEEKKYYLKHRFLIEEGGCNYLNYNHSLRELILSDKGQSESIQTQFTQREIDEIEEKYDTDLQDFEVIEVEEWKSR